MNISDTLNKEIKGSKERIAAFQAQIESLSKELEKERKVADILEQALKKIGTLEEIKET